jgi:hypothetical protein
MSTADATHEIELVGYMAWVYIHGMGITEIHKNGG